MQKGVLHSSSGCASHSASLESSTLQSSWTHFGAASRLHGLLTLPAVNSSMGGVSLPLPSISVAHGTPSPTSCCILPSGGPRPFPMWEILFTPLVTSLSISTGCSSSTYARLAPMHPSRTLLSTQLRPNPKIFQMKILGGTLGPMSNPDTMWLALVAISKPVSLLHTS